jgi:hypothetical protein
LLSRSDSKARTVAKSGAKPAAQPVADAGPEAAPEVESPSGLPPVASKPMRPIGPEGLKALREAIQSGRYPSDAAVRAGLERLIRKPE